MQPVAFILAALALAACLHPRSRPNWALALFVAAFMAQFLFTMDPWTLG